MMETNERGNERENIYAAFPRSCGRENERKTEWETVNLSCIRHPPTGQQTFYTVSSFHVPLIPQNSIEPRFTLNSSSFFDTGIKRVKERSTSEDESHAIELDGWMFWFEIDIHKDCGKGKRTKKKITRYGKSQLKLTVIDAAF